MRIALVTAAATAALLAAAATAFVGVRVAGEPEPRSDAPVATTTEDRRREESDLEEVALALMPETFTLHGRQNTLERTCFVGDGARVEPCSEFAIDGPGVVGDRRRELEQRAARLGWRVHEFDVDAPAGPTLRLARGNLRARVVFGPAGVTADALASNSIRVWDPSRRRSIDEPVGAEPQTDEAARGPFVAAANAACVRFSRRMMAETKPKPTRDQVIEIFAREWQHLVSDFSRLQPHRDDASAATALLRELRTFGAVLRTFDRAAGEDALPAVAGLLHQGQRVEAAFAQFGLTRCRGFTGTPPGRS